MAKCKWLCYNDGILDVSLVSKIPVLSFTLKYSNISSVKCINPTSLNVPC